MAKARSPKLRTLITLHALFKQTDENHRLNSVKLNDFLRPYGLECNKKIIMDTAEKLCEAGILVNLAGGGTNKGICLTNRPLPDHQLKRLIYAIDTNPNLTKQQAKDLLEALKPCVTVYQEPQLHASTEAATPAISDDGTHRQKLAVIQKAMSQNHRVCFSTARLEVDKKKKALVQRLTRAETFLPRYLIPVKGELYAVGYNHTRQRVEALSLNDMRNLRMAQYNNLQDVPEILKMLAHIDPYSYLPKEGPLIYKGPVTFYCGAKYLKPLYAHFGVPSGPVTRDDRYRLTYQVPHAIITAETLQWLGDLPGRGIRIVGPDPLLEAVRGYYSETASNLLGPDTSL